MGINIIYSKNVVGCRIKNDIFIHPELYKYPELYHAVLEHEKGHTDKWNIKDLKLDLFGHGLKNNKKDYYKFMLAHPRTLLGYLPITKVGKYWGFDFQLFCVWLFALIVGYYVGVNL